MDKKVRLKRLNQLKVMLDNHKKLFPEVKFDIETWMAEGESCSIESGTCGTAACALGSAALYGPFNKEGLKINGGSPHFKGFKGFDAGQNFFGISYPESEYLFDPQQYNDERYVGHDYNPHNVSEKVLKLDKAITDVKPKHVSARVAVLIKHYENNEYPLLFAA